MLFANRKVFSLSWNSKYEKTRTIILAIGSAMINPAKPGFLTDNKLAVEMIILEIRTFKINKNIRLN